MFSQGSIYPHFLPQGRYRGIVYPEQSLAKPHSLLSPSHIQSISLIHRRGFGILIDGVDRAKMGRLLLEKNLSVAVAWSLFRYRLYEIIELLFYET